MTEAVMIEWEASNVSFTESLEGNVLSGFLCASVVNPGINNARQFVQLEVVSEDFMAQGSPTIL